MVAGTGFLVYHLHFLSFNVVMAVSGYGTGVLQVRRAAVFQPIFDLSDDGEAPGVNGSIVQEFLYLLVPVVRVDDRDWFIGEVVVREASLPEILRCPGCSCEAGW